jgi:hypothetical protein
VPASSRRASLYTAGDLFVEATPRQLLATWKRTDHNIGSAESRRNELVADGTQSTSHAVSDHGSTNSLCHHKAETRWLGASALGEVDDRMVSGDALAPTHCGAEVISAHDAVRVCKHNSDRDRCGSRYAESSVRPFARRAARMPRPARVRMRRRKPCTLARLRLFGWKVLLLIAVSPNASYKSRKDAGCPKAEVNWLKIRG